MKERRTPMGVTEEGILKKIKAQVCNVNQPLLSVRKGVEAGNRVVFERGGSYIQSETDGRKIWLTDKQGMYVLKMGVKRSCWGRCDQTNTRRKRRGVKLSV